MDAVLGYSTLALALFTAILAGATFYLAKESREASLRQIRIQTWLEFSKRFDSEQMISARATLAGQLSNSPPPFDEIDETLINFFEDLGMLYREHYIERRLAKDTFGFFASRWWKAMKGYVEYQRNRRNEDTSLFEDFEKLVPDMRIQGEIIDNEEIKRFLEDEKGLAL